MLKQLTNAQKNMYDTQQFFNNKSICNIGGCIFLKDNVQIDLLKKAINKLIKNADGIRIRLKIENMIAFQYINEYIEEEIEVIKTNKNEYQKIVEESMQIPFDITGKLYDFKIIDNDGKIGIYIKLHHVVSDAWSAALVAKKIVEYYQLLKDGKDIEDNTPSYDNFIENEKKYLESEKYLEDKEYWENKYTNKPTYVSMNPRSNNNLDVKAKRNVFDIKGDLAHNIYEYCNKNDISLAILFEAVTMIYSARINNSDDVTLCSVVINRNGIKEKQTIGMFNNILPLTININYDERFNMFCEEILEQHFEIFRHQKYPLEDIMKDVRKKFDKDTNLYDIMVSYQNAQIENDNIEDLQWIFNGTSDLGFMINISNIDGSENIHIDLDWRENQFNEQEIEKIFNRLLYIISQIIENNDILIKDIDILTKQEEKQILVDFNDTQKDYPKDRWITKYLEENVIKNPDKIALKFKEEKITYKEFNEKVNSLARYIKEKVSEKNVIIGAMFERSFEMYIAIYAIIKSGNSYMPIDPHFPIDRIEFMIEDSKTPIILTQDKWSDNLKDVNCSNIVAVDNFKFEEYDNKDLDIQIDSNSVAYVIYTSGSTGKPKGAMIPHHSAINRIKWMHEKYPLINDDVILQKTPYTFDVSVWEIFWWSMYNGTLNILIPEGHKDPLEIIDSVYNGKVTHMHFVPSMLNAFLEYLEANKNLINKLSTLRYVFASGEALQVEHVKKFYKLFENIGTTLHNLYGPTECTVDVSYYDCDKECNVSNIPIGKPVDNTQLLILDKNHKLLPVGVVGELYISGVLVGKGYINREELTQEKFVPNIYYNYPTMYKTGDLAMWLPDGNIEYCGRTDFQVKIRGLRVELGDIENAILKYEGITHTIVTFFELNGEKHLCGYYTANTDIDMNNFKAHLNRNLPEYMVPQYFVRLDVMPVNDNGKINRKVLPIPQIEEKNEEYVGPANKLEEKIQKYIIDLLEIDNISCTADLFDYGLTSLTVISVIVKLSIDGYELKVKDFYEQRTIQNIANKLGDLSEEIDSNYEEDEKLYSDVSDIKEHLLPKKEGNAILITGATSFLGIHIIQELYDNTDKYIFCLIRNKEKFERYIHKYTNISYPNNRLIAINGDITKDDLGLDKSLVSSIQSKISDVIHCAADVSFFCPWEKAKTTNYIGTCKVLEFTQKAKAKLHHISTMSVSGDILTRQTKEYPQFTEKQLYIGQLYKENVYAHSKYLAEKEVIKAIREDKINASIYRIANLTWRVSDGKFQENYDENDLYILTSVMKRFNKVPLELMKENISITPVDDCAKAITKLINNKENEIYNLYSKNSMSIQEYMDYFGDVKPVKLNEFYNMLKNQRDREAQFVSMYIAGILQDASKSVVKIINDETNSKLDELNYKWSILNKKYIDLYNKIGGEDNE